jgi:hypothetical protein
LQWIIREILRERGIRWDWLGLCVHCWALSKAISIVLTCGILPEILSLYYINTSSSSSSSSIWSAKYITMNSRSSSNKNKFTLLNLHFQLHIRKHKYNVSIYLIKIAL